MEDTLATEQQTPQAVLEKFLVWAAGELDASLDDYTPTSQRVHRMAYENVYEVIEESIEQRAGAATPLTWNDLRTLYYRLFKTAWDIRYDGSYTFAFEMRALFGATKKSLFAAATELDRLMEEAGH